MGAGDLFRRSHQASNQIKLNTTAALFFLNCTMSLQAKAWKLNTLSGICTLGLQGCP